MAITPAAPALAEINALIARGFRKFDIANEDIRLLLEENRVFPYNWNKDTWTNIPFILNPEKFGFNRKYVEERNSQVDPNEIYIYYNKTERVIMTVAHVKCVSRYSGEISYEWKNEFYSPGVITRSFDTLEMIFEKISKY